MRNNLSLKLHQKAFTLIELLVVMAIIGVLAALIVGGFRTSQAKSRDAQRKSDLKQVTNALEIYYADFGKYPNSIPWGEEFSSGEKIYFKEVPVDPSGAFNYFYRDPDPVSPNQKYQLFAYLENSQDRGVDPNIVAKGYNCGAESCNFGISSTNTTPTE